MGETALSPLAYALRTLKMPHENLADIKAQADELGPEGKNELAGTAREQMVALGIPIKEATG